MLFRSEAAAHGLPAVATPLLAKQLGWTAAELGIAENSETFATACVDLYRNEQRWLDQRNAALERIRKECSPELFRRQTAKILEA